MTTPDFAALAAQIEKDRAEGTPGPWSWNVSRHSKTVELCGGKGGFDLTVMDFVRYGMTGAAPRFWKWCRSIADEPKRAEELAVPLPGRDHHASWRADIDHPDAQRIARVPDLETAFLACYAALQAAQAETQRAVEAEREECARVADITDLDDAAQDIAAAIRERGKGKAMNEILKDELPSTIWAGQVDGFGGWHRDRDIVNRTPYVRADLHAAVVAEQDELRAALQMIADGECVKDWSHKAEAQMRDFAEAALAKVKP